MIEWECPEIKHSLNQNSTIISSRTEQLPNHHFVYDQDI